MKLFLLAISLFWITIGLSAILIPSKLKNLYISLVKPVKILFILPLLAGVLFFWAAPISSLQTFIRILGVLAIIKGLYILLCPVNSLRSTFNYFIARSAGVWRGYGVFMVALGVVVAWSVM